MIGDIVTEHEDRPRTLTTADVEAITDALEKRMKDRFFNDLGKGVWGVLWRAVAILLLMIAAWGSTRDAITQVANGGS